MENTRLHPFISSSTGMNDHSAAQDVFLTQTWNDVDDWDPPMQIPFAEGPGFHHLPESEQVFISPNLVSPIDLIQRPSSAPVGSRHDNVWARDVRSLAKPDETDAALGLLNLYTTDTRKEYSEYQNQLSLFRELNEELDNMTDADDSNDSEMDDAYSVSSWSSDDDHQPKDSMYQKRSMLNDFARVEPRSRSLSPPPKPKVKPKSPITPQARPVRRSSDPSKPASAIPPRLIHLLSKEAKSEDAVSSNQSMMGMTERGKIEGKKSKSVKITLSEVTISLDSEFSSKKQRKMSTGFLGWNKLHWNSIESPPMDRRSSESSSEESVDPEILEQARIYLKDQRHQLLKKISKRIKQQDARISQSEAETKERKKALSQRNKLVRRQKMLKNLIVR